MKPQTNLIHGEPRGAGPHSVKGCHRLASPTGTNGSSAPLVHQTASKKRLFWVVSECVSQISKSGAVMLRSSRNSSTACRMQWGEGSGEGACQHQQH